MRVASFLSYSKLICRLAVVLAALLTSIGGASVRAAPGDDAIVQAAEAFQKRDVARLLRQVEASRAHVLAAYVEYWALRVNLDEQSADAIRAFLKRHEGTYLADRLRADWLRSLAKSGQWETFVAERPPLINEDAEIVCHGLLARLRRGDASALDEVQAQWRMPRELPESCQPLADRLVRDKRLTYEQVWERARLLGEAGQIAALKRVLVYLPAGDEVDPKAIDALFANPQRMLDKHQFDLSRRSQRELYALAIARLARRDPAAASGYFGQTIQQQYPDAERANVFGQLALPAARSHMAEAIGWYALAAKANLSDEHHAWRTRVLLRERKWKDVQRSIESMSPQGRNDPTWIYWYARALREQGRGEEAKMLFAQVAGQHHFYGNLASEELGHGFSVPAKAHAPTEDEVVAAGNLPGVQRAMAFHRLEMRLDALREWNWLTRNNDDQMLLAVAEYARRQQLWDRAINIAERTLNAHDFNLRFLAPYREHFTPQARLLGLEESWVLGLVRQESRFIAHARSHAGASGLMQLMPATARLVARQIGMKDFKWANVTDPEVNVQLGTSYMRQVLDELDGHPLLASAAYNAGPNRAQRWRAAAPLEGAIYAETIPFNETRDYVKRVFSNTMYYAALLKGENKSLKARLGVVQPRNGGIAAVKVE